MNLKDAFPRPTGDETESALRAVGSRVSTERPRWPAAVWKAAAVLAGLSLAYAVGFAAGRSAPREPKPMTLPAARGEAPIVVRAPVLIAGPRS